tara:strand:- start:51 stop:1094 length:1044 start_codon:yes stop_codon:yes gene_type:complete
MHKMQEIIFITGAGRCGTKLIHSLLDGNPKLNVVPGEVTNIFQDSLINNGLSNKVHKQSSFYLLKNFENELKVNRFPNYKKKITKIKNNLSKLFYKKSHIFFNEFLEIVIKSIFHNNYKTVINIQNENIIGLLNTVPNSKIIHMLRNPLTQINARYLFRYKNPMNFDGQEFSLSFFRNYNSFKNAFLAKDNKRVFILKMEDLNVNTEYYMKKIFKFLNIKFDGINLFTTRYRKKFDSVNYSGKPLNKLKNFNKFGVRKLNFDISCLLQNDLYIISKIKFVNKFYRIKKYNYAANNFISFYLRHLGFIGNKRKISPNIYRLIKLSIYSIYLYFLDRNLKKTFLNHQNI